MGNRANIVVVERKSPVFLYSHWDGAAVAVSLRDALRLGERHDDGAYLTRIIFDRICKDHEDTAGYGISGATGDNSHNVPVVYPDEQVVRICHYSEFETIWEKSRAGEVVPSIKTLTMAEFAALDDEAAMALMDDPTS